MSAKDLDPLSRIVVLETRCQKLEVHCARLTRYLERVVVFEGVSAATRCKNCKLPYAPPIGLFGANDCACPHCDDCYTAEPYP